MAYPVRYTQATGIGFASLMSCRAPVAMPASISAFDHAPLGPGVPRRSHSAKSRTSATRTQPEEWKRAPCANSRFVGVSCM